MANTYLPESTNAVIKLISRVRLYIPDREAPWSFSDAEIQNFLDDNAGVTKMAAADALESKATDEAFVQKVQKTLGEETDGSKTADVVYKRAAMLRAQVTAAANTAKPAAGYSSTAPYPCP